MGCLALAVVAAAAIGAFGTAAASALLLRPTALRVNYLANSNATSNPLRLQALESGRAPDFSWQLESSARGEAQTAFQLQASSDPAFASAPLCDTGRVASNQSLCVQSCSISTAKPGSLIHWRVRASGKAGKLSGWVRGPTVLRGLSAADFTGEFVAAPHNTTQGNTNAPVRLRASASLLPPASGQLIVSAIAYVASPGYYHLSSGGVRVNADTEYGPWPEWTKRVYYDCWNVTELFRGSNGSEVIFGLRIGPGTYGHSGAQNFARHYNASALPLLFEVHVDSKSHSDGSISRHKFVSSSGGGGGRSSGDPLASPIHPLTFSAHSDPILSSDWYSGESVDNTLSTELDEWDTVGYSTTDKGGWLPVMKYDALEGRELTPTLLEPIIRVEEIKPSNFSSHGGGKFAWGFPQNFGGFAELDVPSTGFTNTTLTVQIGEEQDATGWPTNGHGWWTGDGHLSWRLRGTETIETLRQVRPIVSSLYNV